MKRFIMIMLVAAMALTMFACGKATTSSESSLSTASMPESSSLHTNSAPPLPESSSAPSDVEDYSEIRYPQKLVSYIPEGVDLKEYIVGKWHTAHRIEERWINNIEDRIYYYCYDFKPDGTFELDGYDMWAMWGEPEKWDPSTSKTEAWDIRPTEGAFGYGTYTVKDDRVELHYNEMESVGVRAHTAYQYVMFVSEDRATMQQRSDYDRSPGNTNISLYIKGDIPFFSLCEMLGIDMTPTPTRYQEQETILYYRKTEK